MNSIGWLDWSAVVAWFVFIGALAAMGIVSWMRWTREGEDVSAAGRTPEARKEPAQEQEMREAA